MKVIQTERGWGLGTGLTAITMMIRRQWRNGVIGVSGNIK
jgi:hypothetical protein